MSDADAEDQSDSHEDDADHQEYDRDASGHVETTTSSGKFLPDRREELLDLLSVFHANEKLLASLSKEMELMENNARDDDCEGLSNIELRERIDAMSKDLLVANSEARCKEIVLHSCQLNDRMYKIFKSGLTRNERDRKSPSRPLPEDFEKLLQRLFDAALEHNEQEMEVKHLRNKLAIKKHKHFSSTVRSRELMDELKNKEKQLKERRGELNSNRIKELKKSLKESERLKQQFNCLLQDVTLMTKFNWSKDQTTKRLLFEK